LANDYSRLNYPTSGWVVPLNSEDDSWLSL